MKEKGKSSSVPVTEKQQRVAKELQPMWGRKDAGCSLYKSGGQAGEMPELGCSLHRGGGQAGEH